MNIVAELTISAMCARGVPELPHYEQALILACDADPPPFGTKAYGTIFREVAADPDWLAASLVTNADREGDGAGRLWSLAACTQDAAVAAQIKRHAIDESRHSRWYAAILDITFPGAVDGPLRKLVEVLSQGTPAKCRSKRSKAHRLLIASLLMTLYR